MAEFEDLVQKINEAKHPEEVFGNLGETSNQFIIGLSQYRNFSKLTHPDLYHGSESIRAEEAFKKLTSLWEIAQSKIKSGTYGEIPKDPTTILQRKDRDYEIFDSISQT